jgi:hypothetical protein
MNREHAIYNEKLHPPFIQDCSLGRAAGFISIEDCMFSVPASAGVHGSQSSFEFSFSFAGVKQRDDRGERREDYADENGEAYPRVGERASASPIAVEADGVGL